MVIKHSSSFQEEIKKQQQQQYYQQQQQQPYQNITRSQKEALKDFDAYELKNLELENKKVKLINLFCSINLIRYFHCLQLTVINDDLLKVNVLIFLSLD